jgi:hypothetical protein
VNSPPTATQQNWGWGWGDGVPPFPPGPPPYYGGPNAPPWYPGANAGVSFGETAPQNPVRGHFWYDGTSLWLFDGTGWIGALTTSKPPEVLTAKNFGAVGDGVTDDTVALQTWIRAVQKQALPGYLDPGDYLILSALVADQWGPLVIKGAGSPSSGYPPTKGDSNILIGTQTQDGIVVSNGFGNLDISNITIVANVSMMGGAGIRVKNYNHTYPGPFTGAKIDRVKILNTWDGIVSDYAGTNAYTGAGAINNYTIQNCAFYGQQGNCLDLGAGGDSLIFNNYIVPTGVNSKGVYLTGDSGGLRFLSNKVIADECLVGLHIHYGYVPGDGDIYICNNSFEVSSAGTNNAVLIDAAVSGAVFGNFAFVGNEFENSGTAYAIDIGPGILLPVQQVSITGNQFARGGIRLLNTKWFSITGNVFTSTNSPADIFVDVNCARGIVLGNSIAKVITNNSTTTTVINNVGP